MGLTFVETCSGESTGDEVSNDWRELAGREAPGARFVTLSAGPEVYGFEAERRLGGVCVQSATTALGLRGWEDAFEGATRVAEDEDVPFVVFDLEKIIRMMLHQSGLALEILASPAVLHRDRDLFGEAWSPRDIIEWAVTRDVIWHYRESTELLVEALEAERDVGARRLLLGFRRLLTGRALLDGVVGLHLPTLAGRYLPVAAQDALDDVRKLAPEARIDEAHVRELAPVANDCFERLTPDEAQGLPKQPKDYDALDTHLVTARHRVDPRWEQA